MPSAGFTRNSSTASQIRTSSNRSKKPSTSRNAHDRRRFESINTPSVPPILPMITDRAAVRRILVVKLRAIGDVLLATGVIPNLRKAFPRAEIDFLTEKPAREVVEGNPDLHEVIVFDPAAQSGAGLILAVRRRKYDLVIDLFGNPRSAIVTRLSRAQFRVGYRFGWRRRCYNIVVAPRGGEVHNSEFN